jgi:hypothetical protein
MPLEVAFFHRWQLQAQLLSDYSHLGIKLSRLNGAMRMCKHQVLTNFYSQFCIAIEWLKHFSKLEVCKLNSQCHTFPKWATSIWANVRKLEFNRPL